MHARDLVELAAVVSAQGPALVRHGRQLSATSIEQYWTASKCRLDRWGRILKGLADHAHDAPGESRRARWPLVRGVLEEILTGEVLTRVWAAVLSAHDRYRGASDAEAVGQSVLIGHLEARHRALTLLVCSPAIDSEEAVRLNHLRRRSERWSDLLVGYLLGLDELSRFAVDPQRARQFAEDLRYGCDLRGGHKAWPLLLGSLRAAFAAGLHRESPNADLNAEIASSIVACLQEELVAGSGLPRSLWLVRLANVADDAQDMVEDLLT